MLMVLDDATAATDEQLTMTVAHVRLCQYLHRGVAVVDRHGPGPPGPDGPVPDGTGPCRDQRLSATFRAPVSPARLKTS
jgi:hypothetical protein